MTYSQIFIMAKGIPAKVVYKQKVKVKPIAHHYENEGEPPYIKYGCPICEQIAEQAKTKQIYTNDEDDTQGKFIRFSFPEKTENCPCCGINFDWNK